MTILMQFIVRLTLAFSCFYCCGIKAFSVPSLTNKVALCDNKLYDIGNNLRFQRGYRPPRSIHTLTATNIKADDQKWENGVEDEFGEKIESVKSAIFAAIGGSIAILPFALTRGALLHFNADWEFNYDGLLILTAPLFGITYRYAIRRDNNPNLKQGVIGAFVITRAVATVKVVDICSSIPLNCGPPFYLFTDQMLIGGLINFGEAAICFGGAAYFMETLFKSGALSKFPKMKNKST